MKTTGPKNMTELRKLLCSQIANVGKSPKAIDQARNINALAKTVVNTVGAELKNAQLCQTKPHVEFLQK